jgi:hypothetical protein
MVLMIPVVWSIEALLGYRQGHAECSCLYPQFPFSGCRETQQTRGGSEVRMPFSVIAFPKFLIFTYFLTIIFRQSKELTLNPLIVSRSEKESCLIEASVNSVRVSIRIKQADDIEEILCHKFTRFLMQRSEQFLIMRRKAIEVRRTRTLL